MSKKRAAHRLGLVAEELAADYLQEQGCRILGKRVRTPAGEIDVVAFICENPHCDYGQESGILGKVKCEGNPCSYCTLVIAEVKARKRQEEGLWSVTPTKQQRLIRAAEALLADHKKITGLPSLDGLNIRFDAIIIAPHRPPLHLPNAWYVE